MTVNLTHPAQDVDLNDPQYDKLMRNLQGNIVKPHGRAFEQHILLRFTAASEAIRVWIKAELADRIANAQMLNQQAAAFKAGGTDGGPVVGFFLSGSGYRKLGLNPRKFGSEVFRDGMKDANDALGDRILGTTSKDPKPDTWETPYQGDVDALITIASDTAVAVAALATELEVSAAAVATKLVAEQGEVLRKKFAGPDGPAEPIEHFGYRDGISNPRFSAADLAGHQATDGAGEKWDVGAPLELVLACDPFTEEEDAYGSFLVYRKLAQDVRQFQRQQAELATSLGYDDALAGAMVVGRFQDGSPVSESADDGQSATNDFNFYNENGKSRCPAHAHIRKSNPRGTTPLTSLKSERKRRIVRRGIPFGRPVADIADSGYDIGPDDDSRGLLFLCFQQDIEEQFEFIQHTWVDNEEFPKGLLPFTKDTGDDPLIGQIEDSVQRWPRKWGNNGAGTKRFAFESAVTLKGGEYFFAPSLPFIHAL